jgi:hypothetical protein
MIAMRRWELWKGDGVYSFFPEENTQARQMAVEDDCVLIWEVIARGYNDAARRYNEYLGWDEYQPMHRSDGTPYPEDEDDEYDGA